jgi:hypothetical protein
MGLSGVIPVPRSAAAVKYTQSKIRKELTLGNDEVVNTLRVTRYLGDYVRTAIYGPHQTVTVANTETLQELDKMIKNMTPGEMIEMHFDTSYNFNNKYMSALSFRHNLLERIDSSEDFRNKSPIIPIVTCLHEKRSDHDIDSFFLTAKEVLKKNVSNFESQNKVLISDREFTKDDYLPSCHRAFCWNHIRQNLERKAMDLKISDGDYENIKKDFLVMLKSSSIESYEERRDDLFMNAPHWKNSKLKDYYLKNLDNDVKTKTGRWHLEAIGLKQPENGITNNPRYQINTQNSCVKLDL